MTRKELINSPHYVKATVECYMKNYKSKYYAINKLTSWILKHRDEYKLLNIDQETNGASQEKPNSSNADDKTKTQTPDREQRIVEGF